LRKRNFVEMINMRYQNTSRRDSMSKEGRDLERQLHQKGWELYGNVRELLAAPIDDITFLVFEDGRAFQRRGYLSQEAELPRDFDGLPRDFKELIHSTGVVDELESRGYGEGPLQPSTSEDIVAS
jgi:hypothetical protein